MTTDPSQTGRQTNSADTAALLNTLRSLLTNSISRHVRTPRVLELGTVDSKPLIAELAREMSIEPINDESTATPDVVIIHPQLGFSSLVRMLYAIRNELTDDTLLCGPGIDQPEQWPGLQIALQQFIQDFRNEGGFWVAQPTGIMHLKGLPLFEDIAGLVHQVETDLRAEQPVTTQSIPKRPSSIEPDLIATAIQVLLDREPRDANEIADNVKHCTDMRSLRHSIICSAEFKQKNPTLLWLNFSADEPPMKIQLDTTEAERQALLQHIQSSWEHLGATEPHWSVLTADKFKQEHIANNEDAFYQTGKANVESLWQSLQRNGIDPTALNTCLEYGCGLGRVTRWLAERFDQVYGYDISRAHLAGAGDYLKRKEFQNVALRHIATPNDVAQLEKVDLVYSVIVLQHNPPPIIAMIVRGLLMSLNPGGIAYFQVPTYQRGYYFSCTGYLTNFGEKKGMEMHVLPQAEVFNIADQADAQVLEIFEDSWTGIVNGGRSNTFIIRKRR